MSGHNRFMRRQVGALIWKDFFIMRAHRFKSFLELILPIAMGLLTGGFLHIANSESWLLDNLGFSFASANPCGTCASYRRCNYNYAAAVPPSFATSLSTGQGWLDRCSGINGFNTTEEMFIGIRESTVRNGWVQESLALAKPPAAPGHAENPYQIFFDAVNVYPTYPVEVASVVLGILFGDDYANSMTLNRRVKIRTDTVSITAALASGMAIAAVFAVSAMASTTAAMLVDEKRTKVREHLRVMGVRPLAYLLSSFGTAALRCFLFATTLVAFQAILLKGALPFVIVFQEWLVLLVYCFAMTSFARVLPAFFSRPQFANAVVTLFIAAGIVAGLFSSRLPTGVQGLIAAVWSPFAAFVALGQIYTNNTNTLPGMDPWLMTALLVWHCFFYAGLGEYLYCINPGEFGVPMSPWFPCSWIADLVTCGGWSRRASEEQPLLDVATGAPNSDRLLSSAERASMQAGGAEDRVVIKNLFKFFGSQRETPAVDGLSLSIKSGEILALLGHNGAGKTTTISMITGMLEPTSYDQASVCGHDIGTDMNSVRSEIGFCPQFDVIFDDLSGIQHLSLYAAIKGADPASASPILNRLGLPNDGQRAEEYSGGMKRRLSVGMALVGNASVVFLDEPSSGLDPVSRRELWALLKEERSRGRTIILTTHFMEEADFLGDRIAIMSYGRLYCCDTSAALKREHGVGYYLTCSKTAAAATLARDNAPWDSTPLMQLVHAHVPEATLKSESAGDVTLLLPAQAVEQFGALFDALEPRLGSMGLASCGVKMNTLEDVFLTIADREAEAALKRSGREAEAPPNTETLPSGLNVDALFAAAAHSSGPMRFLHQFATVFRKRALVWFRSRRQIVLGLLLPLVFIGIGIAAIIKINIGGWAEEHFVGSNGWPDMDDVPVVVCTQSTELYDNVAASLLPEYEAVYRQYQEQVLGNPGRTMSFEKRIGPCIPPQPNVQNLMFGAGIRTPYILSVDWLDFARGNMSYTSYFNNHFTPQFTFMMDMTLQSALAKGPRGQPFIPNIVPELQPVWASGGKKPEALRGSSSSSSSDNGNNLFRHPVWILIVYGFLSITAASTLGGVNAVGVAEDINRGTYDVLRAQGLSAAAYWLGTTAFDMIPGVVLVIAFTAGFFLQSVEPITADPHYVAFLSGAYWLMVVHYSIFGYVMVMLLPRNLKHSTYISIVNYAVWVEAAVPIIISVIITQALDKENPSWLTHCTPSPAFLLNVFLAGEGTDSMFTDRKNVSRTVASIVGWIVGLLVFLFVYVHWDWFARPRTPGPAAQTVCVPGGQMSVDPDVLAEEQRVRNAQGDPGTENMVEALGLRREFNPLLPLPCLPPAKVAVQTVTFGVKRGECFGVLGPNGAGKTTTVRMLLEELAPTDGVVQYPMAEPAGCVHSRDDAYRGSRLGVCVQHDSLIEVFSAAEHMDLYLRVRLGWSYDSAEWAPYIADALRKVQLLDVGAKASSEFSGGMKRKLAACVAMYTGAKVSFLDEPSTGVDPHARRALWQGVDDALTHDRCVVLTTHSMEEADAVCGRIAIVADGSVQCIGSGQHLKHRFGAGYSIVLHLATAPRATETGGDELALMQGVGEQAPSPVKPGMAAPPLPSNYQAQGVQPGYAAPPVPAQEGQPPAPMPGQAPVPMVGQPPVMPGQVAGPLTDDMLEAHGRMLDDQMRRVFGFGCVLQEVLGPQRRYAVPALPSLALAFRCLAAEQQAWGLDGYSVSQVSTLEDIFLTFAANEHRGHPGVAAPGVVPQPAMAHQPGQPMAYAQAPMQQPPPQAPHPYAQPSPSVQR